MRHLAVVITALVAAASAAQAQPTISFEKDLVTAKGITPGSSAVWFGAGQQWGDWFNHVYHFQAVANDDASKGAVTLKSDEGIPIQSVVVVVDIANGEFAAASPPGFAHRGPTPLTTDRASYSAAGALVELTEPGARLDVLLVRKAEGAWATSIFDGGPLDADKTEDGQVTIAFAGLRPIGATTRALDGARPGDVLVVLNPMTLEYSVSRLTAQGQ